MALISIDGKYKYIFYLKCDECDSMWEENITLDFEIRNLDDISDYMFANIVKNMACKNGCDIKNLFVEDFRCANISEYQLNNLIFFGYAHFESY